jgi:cephalosporin hydroxylase
MHPDDLDDPPKRGQPRLKLTMTPEESEAWRPDIEGWSTDILPFYKAIAAVLPANALCVEVGCYFGRSLVFLANELRRMGGGHVTGIEPGVSDPAQQYVHGPEVGPGHDRNVLWSCWLKLVENTKPAINIDLIKLSSLEAARGWRPVDLVFLDGDHREESVRADIRAWRAHVRPGGWLAGHDYGFHLYPGVRKVVDEIFPQAEIYGSVWAVRL